MMSVTVSMDGNLSLPQHLPEEGGFGHLFCYTVPLVMLTVYHQKDGDPEKKGKYIFIYMHFSHVF